jgi:5'-phosphate synthase pdxT subunit
VTPVVGVLALQGDVREHVAALEACGARAVAVRRVRELDGIDGIVLPGGESTTMGKLLGVFELLEPLREPSRRRPSGLRLLRGMILLADRVVDGTVGQQTLGGLDVVVRRNAFGRQVDSFEADLDFRELAGEPVHAGLHPGAVGRGVGGRASRASRPSAVARRR